MAIVASHEHSVRATPREPLRWQELMKSAIRDPRELCRQLELEDFEEAAIRAADGFPLFAPLGYVAKIEPRNSADPLLRQVLPIREEFDDEAGFLDDPVGDLAATSQPGLIHKYHGRVLLITTGACAIHCRYCFRRHFPYSEAPRSMESWQPALQQITDDRSIEEVILSGGDPLTLVDSQLQELVDALSEIPHLTRLRIHTRLPIAIPERVTGELLELLQDTRLTPIVIVHANHPRELCGFVVEALAKLVDAGVPTLNQTVLLRGVNDEIETLVDLSNRLINSRVMPYYLHQLDRVAGASHFEVPIDRGRELIRAMRARLPGYAVPRYVQEVAGQANKMRLD
jgi:EF-P beta-lysylation protein EpmB